MTHFEYMELQGQLTIFDLEDQYEEMKFKKESKMLISLLIKKCILSLA